MGPVAAGGAAFLVAGALAPLLVKFAVGRNLLDVPNLRSSHEVPTPRLGSLAIMAGTWVGAVLLLPPGAWGVLFVLVVATLVGAIGLVDDLGHLHFGAKWAAQTLAASGFLLFYPPQVLSEAASGALKVAVFAVGIFWIVALSNAFNFMDGIDGITGGVAAINAFFLIPLVGEAGIFLPALVGAAVGFLVWNMSPASIFPGDAGAYFLGFGLAAAALYAPIPLDWNLLGLFACALVFTPYLFDTGYTILRRLKAGKNVFSAHREHLFQRVTPTTPMHRRTSNLYYLASVVSGFAALLAAEGGALTFVGAALALALCAGLAALPRLLWKGTDTGGQEMFFRNSNGQDNS